MKEEAVIFVVQRLPSLWNCLVQIFSLLSLSPFPPALPHASSYSLMMGGFGGASIQKAQSLIDLGSSRYEYLTHITLSAFNVGFYLISPGLIQVVLCNGQV